jgi:hypothetical protein
MCLEAGIAVLSDFPASHDDDDDGDEERGRSHRTSKRDLSIQV